MKNLELNKKVNFEVTIGGGNNLVSYNIQNKCNINTISKCKF